MPGLSCSMPQVPQVPPEKKTICADVPPLAVEGFSLTKLAPSFTPTPKSKPLNFR